MPDQATVGITAIKKSSDMTVKPGMEVAVTPEQLADEVKGQVWGVMDHGVLYDAEFTGQADSQGNLVLKIKKRSTKQPKDI